MLLSQNNNTYQRNVFDNKSLSLHYKRLAGIYEKSISSDNHNVNRPKKGTNHSISNFSIKSHSDFYSFLKDTSFLTYKKPHCMMHDASHKKVTRIKEKQDRDNFLRNRISQINHRKPETAVLVKNPAKFFMKKRIVLVKETQKKMDSDQNSQKKKQHQFVDEERIRTFYSKTGLIEDYNKQKNFPSHVFHRKGYSIDSDSNYRNYLLIASKR
jgi:hypothetical protein